MRRIKLSRQEKKIEDVLTRGEYLPISEDEFGQIARSIALRRKDAVLNIRVNSQDLKSIKQKAEKLGVKYQTFIAELIHRAA